MERSGVANARRSNSKSKTLPQYPTNRITHSQSAYPRPFHIMDSPRMKCNEVIPDKAQPNTESTGSNESRKVHEEGGVYTHLSDNCIRLLRVLPGRSDTEIQCTLTEHSLPDCPKFFALSYVWGAKPASCTIKLNGQRFAVRKNLWRYLTQVRTSSREFCGPLWIDAICIDQDNNHERTCQVNLMSQIYKSADLVVMWLGPSYEQSTLAMQHMNKPLTYWRQKHHLRQVWSEPTGTAIRLLCHRPYWTRLWVFQELALAEKVVMMCGETKLPWKNFLDFILEICETKYVGRVADKFDLQAVLRSPATSMISQMNSLECDRTLWTLLQGTRNLRCTEVRDKVYALLGVAEAGSQGISPDYELPIPTLLNNILRNYHRLEKPKTLDEVKKQCVLLTTLFEVNLDSIFSLPDRNACPRLPTVLDMKTHPLIELESSITLWWATMYRHHDVETLLFHPDGIQIRDLLSSCGNESVRMLTKTVLNTEFLDISSAVKREFRDTMLHWTAEFGLLSATQLLLECEATDVNALGSMHRTALHYAAERGCEPVVKVLLQAPLVNIDASDVPGWTPLRYAAETGFHNIVSLLLDTKRPDINAEDRNGWTILHTIAREGYNILMELFLALKQIKVYVKDRDGKTPLHWAAKNGHIECVRMLLDKDELNIDCKDRWGVTPYMLAFEEGHGDAAAYLAERSASTELHILDNRQEEDQILLPYVESGFL